MFDAAYWVCSAFHQRTDGLFSHTDRPACARTQRTGVCAGDQRVRPDDATILLLRHGLRRYWADDGDDIRENIHMTFCSCCERVFDIYYLLLGCLLLLMFLERLCRSSRVAHVAGERSRSIAAGSRSLAAWLGWIVVGSVVDVLIGTSAQAASVLRRFFSCLHSLC